MPNMDSNKDCVDEQKTCIGGGAVGGSTCLGFDKCIRWSGTAAVSRTCGGSRYKCYCTRSWSICIVKEAKVLSGCRTIGPKRHNPDDTCHNSHRILYCHRISRSYTRHYFWSGDTWAWCSKGHK